MVEYKQAMVIQKKKERDIATFKLFEGNIRTGITDEQISVNSVGLNFSQNNANRLGPKVDVLWSEPDRAIAIKAGSHYTLRKASDKSKASYVFARALIKQKKIKRGRYPAHWYQDHKMLIADVEVDAK